MFNDFISTKAAEKKWDVAIVGTGPGGGTAGFELARRGHSVLFLERGKMLMTDPSVVRGAPCSERYDTEQSLRHGWWPYPIFEHDGSIAKQIAIGAGTGGSTALYAMLMERLRPVDFTPLRFFRDTGSTLPEEWPISYDELVPFYGRAEQLYRVHGFPDPLMTGVGERTLLPTPAPSARETAFFDALTRAGLHPYRMHYACEHVPDCNGCLGVLCPHNCRNDAGRMCVTPAVEQHGAAILSGCHVVRLEERSGKVRTAICEWNNTEISISARTFIVAANALLTPSLLQRSANLRFPDGLGNRSGMLGRNLMHHVSDFFLVRFKNQTAVKGPMTYGLSLTDFYVRNGIKLGSIHAHHFSETDRFPQRSGLVDRPIGTIFASIVEDLPYHDNTVRAVPESNAVIRTYRYPQELASRAAALRDDFLAAVQSELSVTPLGAPGSLNPSHACGTCRFGNDPKDSVLDKQNRVHDLDNLYVLDASFFPSSAAVSPSLTVAANSLRVAEQIARTL